jgi:hypothetical protein
MFGKRKEPSQSVSLNNSSNSGPISLAGRDSTVISQQSPSQSQQTTSAADVGLLLGQMIDLIRASALPEQDKSKLLPRLEAAQIEAAESEPDKATIAGNLQRVTDATKSVKSLYDDLKPLVDQIIPWLSSTGVGLG